MELYFKLKINEKAFIKDPVESELGRKIIQNSLILIHSLGFESFTFKKLATEINSTEASIYRYFENKHRLLIYIFDWYWCWQEYRIRIHTNNILNPELVLKRTINLLASPIEEEVTSCHENEKLLFEIIMSEGAKSYLTKQVKVHNEAKLFRSYKELCALVAGFIRDYNHSYKYPFSLSSTIIEMSHSQNFYMQYLPSLTDFGVTKNEKEIATFLEGLVFAVLKHPGKSSK